MRMKDFHLKKAETWFLLRRALACVLACALALHGLPSISLGEEASTDVQASEAATGQAQTADPGEGRPEVPASPAPGSTPVEATSSAPADPVPSGEVADVPREAPVPASSAQAPDTAPSASPEDVAPAAASEPAPARQDGTPQTVVATVRVIGPDATGENTSWIEEARVTLPAGSNAWEASEQAFSERGMKAGEQYVAYGDYLDTITSPFTDDAFGWDERTGRYWQLFVGQSPSDVGAGSVKLDADATITWFYSSYGEALPEDSPGDDPATDSDGGIEMVPDATRPDYEATWDAPQLGNVGGGARTEAQTPRTTAEAAWSLALADEGTYANCSAPVIVDGHLYLAVDDELRMVAVGNGEVVRTAPLAATVGINATIAYADGLVVVALLDGRLQALTADRLATVWLADPFGLASYGGYDPAPGLALHDGYAYVTHFGSLGSDWTASNGRMACVSLSDGRLRWASGILADGFYADGITFVGGVGVATSDAGRVFTFDLASGREIDSFEVDGGSHIRSAPVADTAGNVYVSASDGTLYKLAVAQGGAISRLASQRFADASSSSPTIVGGNVFVGGLKGAAGLLAVINASTLSPVADVTSSSGASLPGNVQCAPLVATNGGATYAYFTANALPGGVFSYRLGDSEATSLFVPPEQCRNYCWYSVVADESGALYYTNDSYTLFKLVAGSADGGSATTGGTQDGGSGTDTDATKGGGTGGGSDGTKGSGAGAHAAAGGGAGTGASRSGSRDSTAARRGSSTRGTSRPASRDSADVRDGRVGEREGRASGDAPDEIKRKGDAARASSVDATEADEAKAAPTSGATASDAVSTDGTADRGIGSAVAAAGVVCGLAAIVALVWWLRRLLASK